MITIQFAAGPTFKPFWQQIKEHGFDVNHFLVIDIVTDDLLDNHWKDMSEKSGFQICSRSYGEEKEGLAQGFNPTELSLHRMAREKKTFHHITT
jgi:hypothetical protein